MELGFEPRNLAPGPSPFTVKLLCYKPGWEVLCVKMLTEAGKWIAWDFYRQQNTAVKVMNNISRQQHG